MKPCKNLKASKGCKNNNHHDTATRKTELSGASQNQ